MPPDVQDARAGEQRAAARIAAGAGPAVSRSRGGAAAGRGDQAGGAPLILAGRGAVLSGAEAALIALAERTGALLATSVCGHGLFADDPVVARHLRRLRLAGGDELIGESDLIVGFGVSFTQWTTKRGKLIAPGRWSRRSTSSGPKLGYQTRSQHAVLGDARVTAEAMLGELEAQASRPRAAAQRRARRASGPATIITAPHPDTSSRAIHRSAHAEQGGRRHPAEGARGGVGLRPFLRLGAALSARAERRSLVPEPFVPVGRARPRLGDRACHRQSRQARRARRRRRRLPDVDRRSRDRDPAWACACASSSTTTAHTPPRCIYYRRQDLSIDIVQFPETDFAAHGARLRRARRDGAHARRPRAGARMGRAKARPACS